MCNHFPQYGIGQMYSSVNDMLKLMNSFSASFFEQVRS